MADLFEKFSKNKGSLGQYQDKAHGYFAFPRLEGDISNRMIFQGKERVIWSLNNYLGLANHPEVRKADADAAAKYGLALPMGARMMSGNSVLHEQLENELAAFIGKEDAFLLNFGYQGMASIVDSLCSRRDVVVYDAESHACILDGLRMAPAHRYVFKHNDLEDFEKQMVRATKMIEETGGGILVISEGVFGMAGDQGKLKEIREKLWDNVRSLQKQLTENGFDIGKTDTPVTPVYMHGGVNEAAQLIIDLRENYDIFCSIVVYPVIPKGHIILRLIPTAVHTEDDITKSMNAFKAVKHKLENKLYPDTLPMMA